jgi:hypothetical protein
VARGAGTRLDDRAELIQHVVRPGRRVAARISDPDIPALEGVARDPPARLAFADRRVLLRKPLMCYWKRLSLRFGILV